MKDQWQPLSDIYNEYTSSLDSAIADGLIDDPEVAEGFIWPVDLHIADGEQDDVKRYVSDRMAEIVDRVQRDRGFDPNLIAGYLFRSVMSGMMWERERFGK